MAAVGVLRVAPCETLTDTQPAQRAATQLYIRVVNIDVRVIPR